MYEVITKPLMVDEAGVLIQFQVPVKDWDIIKESEEWKILENRIEKAQIEAGLNLNLNKVYT